MTSRRKGCGVRTLADLKGRCVVDALTGCWVWQGARTRGDGGNVWIDGQSTTLGAAICRLKLGRPPAPGEVWHVTCRNTRCANPAHRRAGTKSTMMLAAGIKRTPAQVARSAAHKRKLSPEQVAWIRSAVDVPLPEVAAATGVSVKHACSVRSGRRMPLGGLGVSAFTWRPK